MRSHPSSWLKTITQLGFTRKKQRVARKSGRRNSYRVFHQFETLEERSLLSATPWETTTIEWQGQQVEVFKDQWLVGYEKAEVSSAAPSPAAYSASTPSSLSSSVATTLGTAASLDLNTNLGLGSLHAPDMTWSQIDAWANTSDEIAFVEPRFVYYTSAVPNDPGYAGEWGLENTGQDLLTWNTSTQQFQTVSNSGGTIDVDIDAEAAWDTTTGSLDVVIGVIDSGIDYTHPDLYLNIWLNQGEIPASIASNLTDTNSDGIFTFHDLNDPLNSAYVTDLNGNTYIDGGDLLADPTWANGINEDGNTDGITQFTDDLVGWDFWSNDNDPLDGTRHGTHVGGTIGAMGNNGVGVTGVNWDVLLMPMKIGGTTNAVDPLAGASSVAYSAAHRSDAGVNVVATNNSWGGGPFSATLNQAISDASDVLFVAAAGNNSGNNNDVSAFYPASFDLDNIIAVAATDNNDALATFSNLGKTTVDLAAPGVSVLSTHPTYSTSVASTVEIYKQLNGTSMASPHVAGVVGLLAAADPTANAAELKDAVLLSVDPVAGLSDIVLSDGRLNADQALDFLTAVGPQLKQIEAGDDLELITLAPQLESFRKLDDLVFTFTQDIAASSVVPSNFVLKGAGGDGTFGDGNEVAFTIQQSNLSQPLPDQIRILLNDELEVDHYRLTFVGTGANPLQNLTGDAFNEGSDRNYDFEVFQAPGAYESNDHLVEAHDITSDLVGLGSVLLNDADLKIGDGYHGPTDVDLFRFDLTNRAEVSATAAAAVGSELDSYLRLFDSAGNELLGIDDAAGSIDALLVATLDAGTYYLGVSSTDNDSYDATQRNSGTLSPTTGVYTLSVSQTTDPLPSSAVTGSAWHDADDNGNLGAAENGLSGFLVYVDTNQNQQHDGGEVSDTTDALGGYTLDTTGLTAGNYDIVINLPTGWTDGTTGDVQAVAVSSGTVVGSIDFAIRVDAAGTIDVNTTADTVGINAAGDINQLSLRQAVALASTYATIDTVEFDNSLSGLSIVYTKPSPIVLGSGLTIFATATQDITVDADFIAQAFVVNEGSTVTVDGITVTHGNARNGNSGGGFSNAGTLTLQNVTLDHNVASSRSNAAGAAFGGGVYNTGTLVVTDSTFLGNQFSVDLEEGVEIQIDGETARVVGGAGIANVGGSLTVTGSHFQNNRSRKYGGAIFELDAATTTVITDTTFQSNQGTWQNFLDFVPGPTPFSTHAYSGGGAIASFSAGFYTDQPALKISGSTFDDNIGVMSGGAILLAGYNSAPGFARDFAPRWEIESSTLTGNAAVSLYNSLAVYDGPLAGSLSWGNGGAVAAMGGGELTITDSIITGNQAEVFGGGVAIRNASLTIRDSTLTDNGTIYGGNYNINGDPLDATIANGLGGAVAFHVNSKDDGSTLEIDHSNLINSNAYNGRTLALIAADAVFTSNPAFRKLTGFDTSSVSADSSVQITNSIIGGGTSGGFADEHDIVEISASGAMIDQDASSNNVIVTGDGSSFVNDVNDNVVGTIADPVITLIVNTEVDENEAVGSPGFSFDDLSLREALAYADSLGTTSSDVVIGFDTDLFGKTVVLDSANGELDINSDVIIFGPGADRLTVDADGNSRVLHVTTQTDVQIRNLTITGGNASTGGGILGQGDLLLDGVEVIGNTATTSGGGLLFSNGAADLTIRRSTFDGNTANQGAGIYLTTASEFEMSDSTVSRNVGPGIQSFFYYLGIQRYTNVTVSANQGDGIIFGSDLGGPLISVNHSTVTGNTGRGINMQYGYFYGGAWLGNSIVAGNQGASDVVGYFSTGSNHNLIGAIDGSIGLSGGTGTQYGTTANPLDAGLADLGDYGGPTQTHALLYTSTAIDAGDSSATPGVGLTPLYDQRGKGFSRAVDGDGNFSDVVDIGAYETGNDVHLTVTTEIDENETPGTAGFGFEDLSLREAFAIVDPLVSPFGEIFIDFSSDLVGKTINLNHGELILPGMTTTITGFGSDLLTIDAQGNSRVLVTNDETATIKGITLTGGNADAPGGPNPGIQGRGGAIYHSSTRSITLEDVNIEGNQATWGGGVYISSDVGINFINSRVADNISSNSGGGIYASVSDDGLLIQNTEIVGNTSSSGGGLYAIYMPTLDIIGSTFVDNTATGNQGGGLYLGSVVDADIDRSTFDSNTASQGAGLYLSSSGSLHMTGSTVSRNNGSGIQSFFYFLGTQLYENVTVSTNQGDGMVFETDLAGPDAITVRSSTVTGNTGRGINMQYGYFYGGAKLENTIVAGNLGPSDVVGIFNSASRYNLIGAVDGSTGLSGGTGTQHGTSANPLDAGLTALGDYGGPTQTHALLHGSLAIDAGDDALATAFDQRGEDRIQDGNDDGFARIDIGAFELGADEYFGTI